MIYFIYLTQLIFSSILGLFCFLKNYSFENLFPFFSSDLLYFDASHIPHFQCALSVSSYLNLQDMFWSMIYSYLHFMEKKQA